jgi:UDP-GlcNAc:undecaprenyl-phosphate/decaprenyl-phosphate GlcNAc-1-phosphate transferase
VIWLVLGSLIPSMAVAWAAAFWVRRYGPGFGLVDRPGHRKVHQTPTPTSGGLAIWLGIVVPFAVGEILLAALLAGRQSDSPQTGNGGQARPLHTQSPIPIPAIAEPHLSGLAAQSGKLWEVLAGGTVLLILGLIDDRRGLDWRLRLGVQTLVAAVMVVLGWRATLFIDAPLLTGLVSVVWIVGLINSFNMLDNMDGLSAGVAAIAASILAAVMLLGPNPKNLGAGGAQLFVGGFLLVLVGSLLGFLWHNRPPARLFMGDAGSYLVGYLLAIATLTGAFAGQDVPRHAILAPLCVLAVPLYDTATVIWIRLRAGRSPFVGDKSHFSHRLVELGMTKTQAVLTIYLATATCGLGAFLLHEVRDEVGAGVILLLVACTLVLVGILETAGRRHRRDEG